MNTFSPPAQQWSFRSTPEGSGDTWAYSGSTSLNTFAPRSSLTRTLLVLPIFKKQKQKSGECFHAAQKAYLHAHSNKLTPCSKPNQSALRFMSVPSDFTLDRFRCAIRVPRKKKVWAGSFCWSPLVTNQAASYEREISVPESSLKCRL